MSEYIEREALLEECHWVMRSDGTRVFVCHADDIENAPAADVAPVRHGEWKPYFEDVPIYNAGSFTERKQTGWICGSCKRKKSFTSCQRNYCSECGAEMDGEPINGKSES